MTDLRDLDDTQVWPAPRSDAAERAIPTQLLLIDCPDEVGLVHKITGVLFRAGLSIVSNHEYVDPTLRHFYMRTAFLGAASSDGMLRELRELLPAGANIRIASTEPRRIVVLATKEPHCLGDLLLRHAERDIPAKIEAVVARPVTHAHTAADMARAGRDVEKIVLAHGLTLLLEERVFLSGDRAVVFE